MGGPNFCDALRPQPIEVACGVVLSGRPQAPPLGRGRSRDPRTAMEDAVRRALRQPPCLVSFSGGRDSSAVLAVAAKVARREGLALPIPITHRFPGAPAADEDAWQERVVAHLGLPDWERIVVGSELDSVGPVARTVLRRHGLLWPFNAHFHLPLFERAAGGSFLTGVGGDELCGHQMWRPAQQLLAARSRPTVPRVRTAVVALSPPAVRRFALLRVARVDLPWMHAAAVERLRRERVAACAQVPLRWDRAVEWWWRSRSRVVLARTIELLAADAGTQLVQPFLEPSVLRAAARRFGVRGPYSRSTALRAMFGDLLPPAVLTRTSKSRFDEAFFADHSRAFVASWTGGGIDAALVDVERLAGVWHDPVPDARTFSLLQAAWLASEEAQ